MTEVSLFDCYIQFTKGLVRANWNEERNCHFYTIDSMTSDIAFFCTIFSSIYEQNKKICAQGKLLDDSFGPFFNQNEAAFEKNLFHLVSQSKEIGVV